MDNIKIAFWDWNGTLWNDTYQWFLAAKEAYAHAKIKDELTLSRLQDAYDVPVKQVIHTLGAPQKLPQANHERLLKTFVSVLADNEDLASIREGAEDILEFFETRGIENYLVSNHPRELLRKEMEKGKVARFFKSVCGNDHHDQVYTKGTKEERIARHLEETGVLATDACIIADTREEIRIAKKFGMTSVSIVGGYNSERVLMEMQPDHLIVKLSELRYIVG